MENGAKGKQQLWLVSTKKKGKREWQTSGLFAANGNGKNRCLFFLIGTRIMVPNLQLLFQQTCPSMPVSGVRIAVPTVLTQHK
jgi:hypothetical protein